LGKEKAKSETVPLLEGLRPILSHPFPWVAQRHDLTSVKTRIEDPCGDSPVFDPELRPKGARRSQAAGNAIAFALQFNG